MHKKRRQIMDFITSYYTKERLNEEDSENFRKENKEMA